MNIGIVVRSTGEPTTFRLIETLKSQFGIHTPIKIVSGNTFSAALESSYREAILMNKEWTLIIDGDLLVTWNFKKAIEKACRTLPNNAFGFSLQAYDRFYDKPKFRGVHIYRSKFIILADKFIDTSSNHLRPESEVKKKMLEIGFPWYSVHSIIGLHDFYQSPAEIFSKMAIRAHRSKNDVYYLKSKFERIANKNDFKYALAGLIFGMSLSEKKIKIERNFYLNRFSNLFPENKNNPIKVPNNLIINLLFIYKMLIHSPKTLFKNVFITSYNYNKI